MTIARSSSKAALALISAGFLLAAFAVTSAFGTTLLSLSVNSLSEQAEFVFEGEVIAVEAQRSGSRGMVSTFVTFRVIDTLKGDAGAIDIELKFLGGTLNGEVLEVNGSRLPKLGERGVYFVESLSRDLINPLLGWSQGHYLITTNGGVDSMTTVDAKPIIAVSPIEMTTPSGASGASGSLGASTTQLPAQTRARSPLRIAADPSAAEGIIAIERDSVTGISPADFKREIRALIP
tara:strand:- start:9751 stop:10455 length:705 start_codon:yes stop_codon:yes gene_type:complete